MGLELNYIDGQTPLDEDVKEQNLTCRRFRQVRKEGIREVERD